MYKRTEIHKCNVCGGIVETTRDGGGTLVCCGKEMVRQKDNFVDASEEKHIPVIEQQEDGILVKIGEVEHPMEGSHYIEWVEIITKDGKVDRKYLKPEDSPNVKFNKHKDIEKVRAYCNLHGLWVTKM